jgi:DNA processing protein
VTARRLTDQERFDWLRLARTESVGPVTFAHLIGRYGSSSRALAALPELARRGGGVKAPVLASTGQAEAEMAAGAALGARLIVSGEEDFPRLLAVLDPPPPLIWALGDVAILARPAVAVVGSRECSAAGQRMARTLAHDLGVGGYVVISGLARGIDAAAHHGAIATGTIAVLAGGVDRVWPPQNADLYEAILAKGCIVSDRPIGHEAKARDFPRRNRLISGLALGVVVVEAELRSGSLITARLAGEQGREVFAVPGSPLDPRARGANDLLRQGATLVEEADDVLRVLDSQPSVFEPDQPTYAYDLVSDGPETEGLVEVVEALLSPTPTSIDELARAAEAPMPAVLAALMELTLAGRAELMAGGLVVAVR